jgi:hypothetical protein
MYMDVVCFISPESRHLTKAIPSRSNGGRVRCKEAIALASKLLMIDVVVKEFSIIY